MIKNLCRFMILTTASVAVAACTPQGQIAGSSAASAEQLELGLLACKDQLGLPGQTKTQVSFDGGVPTARVVPFDQITATDAAQINVCAAGGTATLEDGLQVVPLQSGALTQTAIPATFAAGECPRGRSGLYAGTSYCFAKLN